MTFEPTPAYNSNVLPKLPKSTPILLVGAFLLVGAMKFLIRFFQMRCREAKIKKLPNSKKVIYLYEEIIKLTHLLGYTQECGETHHEYANRVARNFYFFTTEKGIKEITEIFVKNKYGKTTKKSLRFKSLLL